MNKKAFTLAEVLITLGIIGIVAAITLPALVGKYRSKVAVAQLKKMYSIISQAMLRAMPDGDYGNLTFAAGGGLDSVNDFFYNYLKPQLKITQICTGQSNCATFKKLNKKNQTIGCGSGIITFKTPDGYQFCIDTWSNRDSDTVENTFGVDMNGVTGSIVTVFADINGEQKPNILGKDVFVFVLNKKGLVPAGYSKTDTEIENECKNTGYYCFTKIIRNNWEINQEDLF